MKPNTTVQPVRGRRERREFVAFPFRVHGRDSNWVPPLNSDIHEKLDPARHPFYEYGEAESFLARRGKRVTGRVTALINPLHNEFHGEKAAGFGLIDFERDEETAAALVRAAAEWGRERGMTVLRGPFSLSTNEECGTLIEGFDTPPCVMMPWNPEWHPELLAAAGLRKAKELIAYIVHENTPGFERMKGLTERLSRRHSKGSPFSIRPFDPRRLESEIDIVRNIYNSAWEKNWGLVPMTEREFRWQAKKLKPALDPELALIAERNGEPAAFSLTLPDLNPALASARGRLFPFGLLRFLWNRRKISGVRVLTLGVKKEFRGLGLEGMLIHRTIEAGGSRGYKWAELSWILEDNIPIRRILEQMGAKIYKKYAIWEADVEELLR